jgi:hypothetical protein
MTANSFLNDIAIASSAPDAPMDGINDAIDSGGLGDIGDMDDDA